MQLYCRNRRWCVVSYHIGGDTATPQRAVHHTLLLLQIFSAVMQVLEQDSREWTNGHSCHLSTGSLAPLPIAGAAGPSHGEKIAHLEGLRGVLCVMVVVFHFACAFAGCTVFGPNPSILVDPNVCPPQTPGMLDWLLILYNGPFAVQTFFVMSGFVLSLRHLSHRPLHTGPSTPAASDPRLALSVAKRYFRLMLPCVATTIMSYAVAGSGWNVLAARMTGNRWFAEAFPGMPATERPPLTGLPWHLLFGVWQGACNLNVALWTMPYELFGSYLVFGLVALLRTGGRAEVQWVLLAAAIFCLGMQRHGRLCGATSLCMLLLGWLGANRGWMVLAAVKALPYYAMA